MPFLPIDSMRTSVTLALSLLLAGAAQAQAPRITKAGDPSVRNDTIYRLAVDPAQHPEESAIFLLDDGVLRYEADGTGTVTFRQVSQILKQDAVEHYTEHSFSYEPGHQSLTLNWIRVVKPNGEVVSAEPTMLQESDVPAEMSNPIYNDRKVIRASLSGVEPGVLVDYSYTLEERKPYFPGDFFQWWGVSTGLETRRSRLIVDLPSTLVPRIVEKNLNFPRKTTRAGDRTVYEWSTKDLPRIKPEPLAADSNGIYMSVAVSSPTSWADIARWYASLARDRYTVTAPVEAELRDVVKDARTRADTIHAVHRWVAQDVRYLSVALGMGGYQPRSPDEVIRTGFGDCKDKATLFVAALGKLGITAYPVLLNSTGGVDPRLPSIEQFDHAIAAVPNPGGGYTFVDLTADLVPYGSLPYAEQGEFALVVHPDGSSEELTMPQEPVTANESITRLTGELSAEGIFRGTYEVIGRGAHQYDLRGVFANELNQEQRVSLTRSLASQVFNGATGDSLVTFDGTDLSAEARVSLRVSGGKAATLAGGALILTNPFGTMGSVLDDVTELEASGPRRFPIDAEKVLGGQTTLNELRLTLPEGMVATLPPSVRASSAFGEYSVEYAQKGRELTMVRRITGARGVHAPARLPELLAWYRAMAKDDAPFIALTPAKGE
jgi:transglutaminase-like putative cysteine protease